MKTQIKASLIIISLIFAVNSSFAQKDKDKNLVFWSATKKLTLDDFSIKTKNMESGPASGQFTIDYQLNGFNIFTKNFNKKIRNYLVKTGSQIDTTGTVEIYLLYQQTIFDLCEIYTRHFRKELRENRSKFMKGASFADELNMEIMKQLMIRREEYTKDTNSATKPEKQKEWEDLIKKELEELADYAYDK